MRFIFEQIQTGGDRNFGYLIGDREAGIGAFIDPSYAPEALIERANAQGLKIQWIINTHGHSDHTNGNERAKELTGAQIAIWHTSAVPHNIGLKDEEVIEVGAFKLQVIHTPGHIEDHVVIYNPDFHIAMTGDHLFVGKIGGTATDEDAQEQWDSLNRILKELPPETTVWPGHDVGCRPSSTLQLEKATNPFLQAKDFEAFKELKGNWASYKAENGLK